MDFKVRSIQNQNQNQKKISLVKIFFGALVFVITVFIAFSFYVLAQVRQIVDSRNFSEGDSIAGDVSKQEECGVFGCMKDMIFNQTCAIRKSNDRTNVLVLGAGGKEQIQGGTNLTDTIIVLSFDHKTSAISMVSIPRDLWVRPPGLHQAKINTLYEISKRFYQDGFTVPKATIEDLLAIQIHYYAYIDFKGFKDVIDALGGVEVNVDNPFTDRSYPDGKFGYKIISFETGLQVLDGDRALQFVRSRHGNNGESSDFARARRQHKILTALKDKVLSFGTILQIDGIVQAIKQNYLSNLEPCELYRFALLFKDIPREKFYSLVLDDGPAGLLYTPTQQVREASYGGQYLLLPDGNNYKVIAKYVERFLQNPENFGTGPTLTVLNGTGQEGLANKVGANLMTEGFKVNLRQNTYGRRAYPNTIIYTKNPGDYYQTLLNLQNIVKGEVTGTNPEPLDYGTEIVVIIGKDYLELEKAKSQKEQ